MLSTGDLIDQSWTLYRRHFRAFLPFLVLAVAGAAASTAFNGLFNIPRMPLVLAATLLGAFIVRVFIDAGFAITADALVKPAAVPSFKSRLGVTLRILPLAASTYLLSTAIFAAGFALFILPGILFFGWFALAPLGTVLGGLRPFPALTESRRRAEGRFFAMLWRITGPFVFWQLASFAVAFLLTAILEAATDRLIGAPNAAAPLWITLTTNGIYIVIGALAAPMQTASLVLLYRDTTQGATSPES